MSLNVPKCPVYVKGYEIIKNLKIFSNLAYCRLSLHFAILFRWLKLNSPFGGVVEWFKALVLKTSVSARAPWVRIPPPPYLENLHRVSYPTIGRQNYFNSRYKSIFERFKKPSLVIALHKKSDRLNYLLGDLLWDLLKITGGLNSIYKSN